MSKKEIIVREIDQLPERVLDEIVNYVQLLKQQISENSLDTLLLSESSLKKDWLRPEEDKAWQNL
ncbi:MAG TPA: DUF2281 domain-containing protein [Candidatus Lokiarchaeia archaeon]|nr:DUF2281 domain-containing protein [Candidatus Lokiarchaeia archaeon]